MTRELEHVNAGTPFGAWMRRRLKDSKEGLSVSDIDTTVYAMWEYNDKVLYLLEEKAFGDTVHNGQSRLFGVLSSILSHGCKAMGVTWNGLHIVRMQNSGPENSEWLELDGRRVTQQELAEKLNALTQRRNGNSS